MIAHLSTPLLAYHFTLEHYFHAFGHRLVNPPGRLVVCVVAALIVIGWGARRLETNGSLGFISKSAYKLAYASLPFAGVGAFAVAWTLFNTLSPFSGPLLGVNHTYLGPLSRMLSITNSEVLWLIPALMLAAAAILSMKGVVQYIAAASAFWGFIVVVNFFYILFHARH